MSRHDNCSIVYPPNCRPVTEDLQLDELVRRFKNLAHTLQSMGQDDGAFQEYIPLAMHIAEESYLQYPSKDVQLLVACCIADILRVYAPEAPYKDPAQVKGIFLFLIRQLGGLKDPKDPAFKRYFYLLENLAYVKSFNMCFELEDSQEIFCKLFKLMFNIVSDEHSGKVKSFMLDVLNPLIIESDVVSNDLLDIILSNIIEPMKQQKNSYNLAKDVIIKCADTLEPYIQAFFNHVLILGKEEKCLTISHKVYNLLYELNHIHPPLLLTVLPQLEFKLKSTDEQERHDCVSLLARMFSEKNSDLAEKHQQLWRAFLGRFNDISSKIRLTCVQYSMHFLVNQPSLRKDITEALKLRLRDSDESIRYEVVLGIVSTAKNDSSIVSDSEELLHFVKERTLDKKFKIRKEAMCGLAMIYKKMMSNNSGATPSTKLAMNWIKDKILHGYYMTSTDDRVLVERLLNMCLVPYQLSNKERMIKLFQLFATMDENAGKAFIELQKHQLAVRKCVAELVDLHRLRDSDKLSESDREKEINSRIGQLAKFLPDPIKVQEYLIVFSQKMSQDSQLLSSMDTIVSSDVSCKSSIEAVGNVLKSFGTGKKDNLCYHTIKMILERVSNVLIDGESLEVLVRLVKSAINGSSEIIEDLDLPTDIAAEKGLKLLFVLSFVHPAHFLHKPIISELISLLKPSNESSGPPVLSILSFIGKYKPIGVAFPELVDALRNSCDTFCSSGTVKQAKQAVRCIVNNLPNESADIFTKILEKIKDQLVISSPHVRTSIVTLGHIAISLPDKFMVPIKNLVSRKIVREIIMKNQSPEHTPYSSEQDEDLWLEEEDCCEETRIKLEALKMMARWLLGLKNDVISAQKTFRMLNAIIRHKGDLLECGKMIKGEMAQLRLAAGCAMLKICVQKGVGDQYTSEQFYSLSLLMLDPCHQVRERFSAKLHKGLARGIPAKCLPLDFMGFYSLSGLEEDKELKKTIKQYMLTDVSKRREYIRSISLTGGEKAASQLPYIMPDYMLVFSVALLAHLPFWKELKDKETLLKLRACLWFILEPLIIKNDSYCFGFYKALIEQMKNHKDAVTPSDDSANHKLWAICDLAMGLILQKTTSFEMKNFPSEPRITPMHFKKHEDPNFVNDKCYLPEELQVTAPKGATKILPGVKKSNKNIKKEDMSISKSMNSEYNSQSDLENSVNSEENSTLKRSFDSISDNDNHITLKRQKINENNNKIRT